MDEGMSRLLARAYHWLSWRSGHALREIRATREPRVLTYHGVGPQDTPVEQFDWQLRLLRDEFELVGLPELVDRLLHRRLTGDEVALTFDDGVRNHFTQAWPLLASHRVPVTFFICPGLMDSGRWIWNMEMRVRLRLLDDTARLRLALSIKAVGSQVERIIARAKQLEPEPRHAFEEAVRLATHDFEADAALLDRYAPMQWEQARAMDPALATLGSHSLTHPILTTLGNAEREVEIAGSRARIEAMTGRTADLFCYPNGSHDAALVLQVRRHYRAAFITQPGFASPQSPMHRIPRISAGAQPGLFLRRLHRPVA
jgi:peptidoglycan/xylan/chitin deacetylase (PgdA/CDA1 family)